MQRGALFSIRNQRLFPIKLKGSKMYRFGAFRVSMLVLAVFSTILVSAQTFSSKSYSAGPGPQKLIRADFNHDGYVDLATANQDGTVTTLINNRAGGFNRQDAVATTSGLVVFDLASADFNRDGNTDLVAVSYPGGTLTLTILIGRGDGTFNAPVVVRTGTGWGYVTTGDFNGDGNADIAYSWSSISSSGQDQAHVTLLYGNGAGTFPSSKTIFPIGAPPSDSDPSSGFEITHLTSGDFDGDGRTDFAFTETNDWDIPSSAGYVYLNAGSGNFIAKPFNAPPANELRTFDIDKNGRTDLMVPWRGCHTPCMGVQVFMSPATSPTGQPLPDPFEQNPGGGFADAFTSATAGTFVPGGPRMVAYSAVGTFYDSPVTDILAFAKRNADGTFSLVKYLALPYGRWLTSADFNKDGRDDLAEIVGSSGQVLVLTNTTPASSTCTVSTNRTVKICAPTSGSTVSSPVRVLAGLRSDNGVTAAQIYVDGSKVYQAGSGTTLLDRSLTFSAGTHRITVKGWDSAGSFSSSVTVTVSGTSTTCTATTNRTVKICSPLNGSSVSSPVRVLAGLRSDTGVTAAQIYLDGLNVYQGPSGTTTINQSISMSIGSHRVTVKGWDRAGSFVSTVTFTVK